MASRDSRWWGVCSGACVWSLLVFFFFQAEDGIRDLTVTGVQTCALPISGARPPCRGGHRRRHGRPDEGLSVGRAHLRPLPRPQGAARRSLRGGAGGTRSEEGRVGEEGGTRGAADH